MLSAVLGEEVICQGMTVFTRVHCPNVILLLSVTFDWHGYALGHTAVADGCLEH